MKLKTLNIRIVDDDVVPYVIHPDYIFDKLPPGLNMLGAFGKRDIERSAERLIHFFVMRGGWCCFTLEELRCFYQQQGWNPSAPLFGLFGTWMDDTVEVGPAEVFIVYEKGLYRTTDRFVKRCAKAVGLNLRAATHAPT